MPDSQKRYFVFSYNLYDNLHSQEARRFVQALHEFHNAHKHFQDQHQFFYQQPAQTNFIPQPPQNNAPGAMHYCLTLSRLQQHNNYRTSGRNAASICTTTMANACRLHASTYAQCQRRILYVLRRLIRQYTSSHRRLCRMSWTTTTAIVRLFAHATNRPRATVRHAA